MQPVADPVAAVKNMRAMQIINVLLMPMGRFRTVPVITRVAQQLQQLLFQP